MYTHMFLGDSWVNVDLEATMQWYRQAAPWDCNCEACRRFVALARERRLPVPVIDTLQKLGIPPENATYVCCLDGVDVYEFCYRIAGHFIRSEHSHTDPHRAVFCEPLHPCPSFDFPSPHFDLTFVLRLP